MRRWRKSRRRGGWKAVSGVPPSIWPVQILVILGKQKQNEGTTEKDYFVKKNTTIRELKDQFAHDMGLELGNLGTVKLQTFAGETKKLIY